MDRLRDGHIAGIFLLYPLSPARHDVVAIVIIEKIGNHFSDDVFGIHASLAVLRQHILVNQVGPERTE